MPPCSAWLSVARCGTSAGTVALLATLTDIRARNAFTFCFVLPLMIAPQVTALAWLQLFGPSSTLYSAAIAFTSSSVKPISIRLR